VLVIILCQGTPIARSIFSTLRQQPIHLFSPPHPIKKFFYRCDRKFYLDDLIKLYETCDNYSIVLISGKRTELYLHNENQTKLLKSLDESLPNKHKTGGQSAPKFGRIRNEKIGWYAKKIIELMVRFYVGSNGKFSHKGLIIAGPAEMKDLVCDQQLFIQYFAKNLLKVLTISEITEQSINYVIRLASDVLTTESSSQKEIIDYFEQKILTNPNLIDLIVFGTEEVMKAFDSGQLKEIFVANKNVNKERILKTDTKTKINLIKSSEFSTKYGELVGIKYQESSDRTSKF